ncbi:MAG: DNA-protecting protein DprA [Oligoflexia bacterium]|nr:DNA-protecting protein DprA [Oligoflexia bacterium]
MSSPSVFCLDPSTDPRFSRLWQILRPPQNLYIEGHEEALELLPLLPDAGFAIVGTRSPQPRSRSLVRERVEELAKTGLIILSGLARGIDAEAHSAALDVGLSTIAILGTGLDTTYPRENTALRKRIVQSGGLVITEFPEGTETVPSFFLKRNRLIAAWSNATWIVEAGMRSGALNTAKWARDHHRHCFATPCFPGDPNLAGNFTLLDREDALPLWSSATLGHAWPGLPSTLAENERSRSHARADGGGLQLPLEGSDEERLAVEITARSAERGGAAVQDLLDWAVVDGWAPQRFFVALQKALQLGLIADEQGVLAAKSTRIPSV